MEEKWKCDIINSSSTSITLDVIRVSADAAEFAQTSVENLPNHSPGEQRGKPVRVRYTIPVRFTIR